MCGWRLEVWLFRVGDVAANWLSILLRLILGRPRFLVGRFGVEDSDADAGDDGDSRFSVWGLSDGETAWCGASLDCVEECNVVAVVIGEKESCSPACGGVGCIEKSPLYCSNCPNCG